MLFAVIVMAMMINSINSQSNTPCPSVTPVDNFDIARYFSGKWYEIARYDNFELELNSDCTHGVYDYNENIGKSNFTVYEITGNKVNSFGGLIIMAPDSGKYGKIIYSISRGGHEDVPLNILATDYDTYGIMYNCFHNEESKTSTDFAWILSRSHELPPLSKSAVDNFMNVSHILKNKNFVWDNFNKDICLKNGM